MFVSANIYETTKLKLRLSMFSLNSKKLLLQYSVRHLMYYTKKILFTNIFTVIMFLHFSSGFWISISQVFGRVLNSNFGAPCEISKSRIKKWREFNRCGKVVITWSLLSLLGSRKCLAPYSEACQKWANSKPCHVQNPGIFRTQAYI